jgi:hypothetical protein
MAANERVTVTLPSDLVRDIDRIERNRSRFLLEAVRHELARRRREQLDQSLQAPHRESEPLAEAGLEQWASGLPQEEASDLVDPEAGEPVQWVPGEGWVPENE